MSSDPMYAGHLLELSSRWNEALGRLHTRTAPLRSEKDHPARTLLVWSSLLVAAWYVCAPQLDDVTRLSEADYRGGVLLVPLLARTRMVAFVLTFLFVLIGGWRRLAWSTFAEGRRLRIFVVLVAGALAWGAALSPYNLFFDQYHAVDRALTLLHTALIWRHPGFTPFSMALSMTVFHSLGHPLGGFSWTDKRVVFATLLLFSLFLVLRLLLGKISCRPYIFVGSPCWRRGIICRVCKRCGSTGSRTTSLLF